MPRTLLKIKGLTSQSALLGRKSAESRLDGQAVSKIFYLSAKCDWPKRMKRLND